jgi:hypothetical protein
MHGHLLMQAIDAAKGMLFLHKRNPPVIHRCVSQPCDVGFNSYLCLSDLKCLALSSEDAAAGTSSLQTYW